MMVSAGIKIYVQGIERKVLVAEMRTPKAQAASPSIAVHRALAMLEEISKSAAGLTNSELSRKLRLPKSSASYVLRALETGGYVRRERDGRYRLGLELLSLSHRALAGLDVREVALPILKHLVDKSGLTAHLAIVDQAQAVYIAKVDAPGFIKMNTWAGRRMNLHSTSVGKALLAHLPPEEVDAMVERKGLKKWTPHTITTQTRLAAELEAVRKRGYAVDEQESTLGVRCVAAPVFGPAGMVEASVGLSATVTQFPAAQVSRMGELVKEAARRISAQMGTGRKR